MSLGPRSRPWIALLSSGLLHAIAVVLVLIATATHGGATAGAGGGSEASGRRSGSVQLGGTARDRPAGRDVLFDILSASDGRGVRLTSPTGDEAVGLAVLSPSRGLWLALDRVSAHEGRTLRAWQVHPGGARSLLTSVTIRDDASGRVIAWWDDADAAVAGAPVTLEVTVQSGVWPFARETRVLLGTTPARSSSRRAGERQD